MKVEIARNLSWARCTLIPLSMGIIGSSCSKSTGTRPSSVPVNLLNGSVSFFVPQDWLLYTQFNKGGAEIHQFAIPNTGTLSSPASGSAIFFGEPAPTNGSVSNWVAGWLSNPVSTEGYMVATNMFCNGKWSTALSRWQIATEPHAVMDRFGVDQGVAVKFQLSIPVSATNTHVTTRAVSDFNQVVRTLKIAGSNCVNSEMRVDHGVIWLRHFSDSNTNWMVETNVVFRTYQPSNP